MHNEKDFFSLPFVFEKKGCFAISCVHWNFRPRRKILLEKAFRICKRFSYAKKDATIFIKDVFYLFCSQQLFVIIFSKTLNVQTIVTKSNRVRNLKLTNFSSAARDANHK